MGKITGFLEFERSDRDYEPVEERIKHWREFVLPLPDEENTKQAARCMDCGIPYCHTGCPVNNQIPDWPALLRHVLRSRSSVVVLFGPRAPLGRRRAEPVSPSSAQHRLEACAASSSTARR